MKKIFMYAAALLLSSVAFTSCSDSNDELTDSKLTNYVVLEVQGDEFVALPLGTSYVDAGCKATLDGQDAASRLVTEGVDEVDENTIGFYEITYSAVNDDGFPISASRTVCVYDPSITLNIEGKYNTDMAATMYLGKMNDVKDWYPFADWAAGYGNTSQCEGITFTQIVPGIFYCNDLLGGWYWQIRGYGTSYAMTGYVSVDNDGNVELISSYIPGWGDGLDYIEEAKYDTSTSTISYSLCYAGQIYMKPVMTKVSDL
ncbi:MAG: DUF5012 domain-containing protein [Muribaculaceae bacterium]|nr:DUF5012 domain-containing protein [Muribaculaceae bacterium]